MAKRTTKPAEPEMTAAEEAVQEAQETAQSAPETKDASQPQPEKTAAEEAQKAACEGLAEFCVTPQGGLNLRDAPGLTEPLLAVLPHGIGVWSDGQLTEDGQWVRVQTGLLAGWVKAEYLTRMPVDSHGAE